MIEAFEQRKGLLLFCLIGIIASCCLLFAGVKNREHSKSAAIFCIVFGILLFLAMFFAMAVILLFGVNF